MRQRIRREISFFPQISFKFGVIKMLLRHETPRLWANLHLFRNLIAQNLILVTSISRKISFSYYSCSCDLVPFLLSNSKSSDSDKIFQA